MTTPRTDHQESIDNGDTRPLIDEMRKMEIELNAAKEALSGRTVSCSNCNQLASEKAKMQETMQIIYDACDSCADGAPDASDHDKLCLELTHTLKPYLK